MFDLRETEEELNDTYGMAFLSSPNGVSLHARYFAALAKQYFSVCFDTERKQFFRYSSVHGVWEPWGNEAIIDAISRMIHDYAVIHEPYRAEIEIKATSGFLSSGSQLQNNPSSILRKQAHRTLTCSPLGGYV